MPNIVFMPQIPSLEFGSGDISFPQLERYFKTLGTIPAQLRIQAILIDDQQCRQELYEAIDRIKVIIDDTCSIFLTPVFQTISNIEHEMSYQVREFFKDIDAYLQKLVLDILFKILDLISFVIPNPFELPIPFIGTVILIDANGVPYEYQPVIIDFFTKEGKARIKAAMRERIQEVLDFFKIDKFIGDWNIVSFDYAVEEAWQRCLRWLNNLLNNTIIAAVNALISFLKDLPIIGQAIKALGTVVDPTLTLQETFDKIYNEAKEQYQKLKDGQIIYDLVEVILGIKIPIFGTLGNLIGFDFKDELKRYKVFIAEELLSRIEDAWNNAMEKIRRFLATGWLDAIYKIIDKAGAALIALVPVVGKIFDLLKLIVNILTGQVKVADIINIILAPIYTLARLVYGLVPKCITIKYTEYGLEPEGKTTPPESADYSSYPSMAYAPVVTT